ncbi:hypothetical protein ACA910_002715 [Epithemia clementina (nom. ined.)]
MMMHSFIPSSSLLMILLLAVATIATAQGICISDTNTYTVKVNLMAGELGYYMFEECGAQVNPTIGMIVGTPYTFLQVDRSNYYHPMGFAYVPDGAHADGPELEPAVSGTGTASCIENSQCPAPMYFRGDTYLGVYSNQANLAPITTDKEDFGLDVYEPEFFRPINDWAGAGNYCVHLKFDDASYTHDLFYFCHIHQFMSGRIKLLDTNRNPINPQNTPALGYDYDLVSGFDRGCGTYGLNDFTLPNPQCPTAFVCGHDGSASASGRFAQCIEAMNCHMLHGMTTGITTNDEIALFMHQMIPHHENAVNMAKTLLHTNILQCYDLTNEDNPDCEMERILRSIINTQNFQIQTMKTLLKLYDFPETDECIVEIVASKVAS